MARLSRILLGVMGCAFGFAAFVRSMSDGMRTGVTLEPMNALTVASKSLIKLSVLRNAKKSKKKKLNPLTIANHVLDYNYSKEENKMV